jgi:hypothetical protein
MEEGMEVDVEVEDVDVAVDVEEGSGSDVEVVTEVELVFVGIEWSPVLARTKRTGGFGEEGVEDGGSLTKRGEGVLLVTELSSLDVSWCS